MSCFLVLVLIYDLVSKFRSRAAAYEVTVCRLVDFALLSPSFNERPGLYGPELVIDFFLANAAFLVAVLLLRASSIGVVTAVDFFPDGKSSS